MEGSVPSWTFGILLHNNSKFGLREQMKSTSADPLLGRKWSTSVFHRLDQMQTLIIFASMVGLIEGATPEAATTCSVMFPEQ